MPREPLDSLDTRQQGLLLALLLFGSKESEALLSFLPDDIANALKGPLKDRLALERNARIQLSVMTLERLFSQERQSRLSMIDPSWISDLLQHEDPVLAKLINAMLSASEKPAALQYAVEHCFAPMAFGNPFIRLSSSDLLAIARDLGQLYLATAFSQLGMQHTASFLQHYGAALQNDLLERLKTQTAGDFMNVDESKLLLTVVFARFSDVNALLERTGLFAMADILHKLQPNYIRPIAQRLDKSHGRLLVDFAAQLKS